MIFVPITSATIEVHKPKNLRKTTNDKYLFINTVKKNCPISFEVLITQLLYDLPSYANRIMQRTRRNSNVDTYSYIILAGKPELEPLPLTNLQYKSLLPNNTKQAFFTTLERRYSNKEVFLLQNHYRIFLSKGDDGWRLISLSSRLANIGKGNSLPLPSRNSINSAVGEGIRLWLRDCRFDSL